jgi:ribosomal protein S18 acetylase RimI-like enzyme
LRSAGAADADALALVASASFLETYAGALDGADLVAHCVANNTREKFAAWAIDPLSAVTLAEIIPGHAPLGYTVLTSVDLPVEHGAGDIELRRIYAMARLHGTGAGPAMMAQALVDAARLGKTRLLLGVWGENHRAHRFYERQGFTVIGTRNFKVGSIVHDDLVYARSVN